VRFFCFGRSSLEEGSKGRKGPWTERTPDSEAAHSGPKMKRTTIFATRQREVQEGKNYAFSNTIVSLTLTTQTDICQIPLSRQPISRSHLISNSIASTSSLSFLSSFTRSRSTFLSHLHPRLCYLPSKWPYYAIKFLDYF
jgi:hypothetical protein